MVRPLFFLFRPALPSRTVYSREPAFTRDTRARVRSLWFLCADAKTTFVFLFVVDAVSFLVVTVAKEVRKDPYLCDRADGARGKRRMILTGRESSFKVRRVVFTPPPVIF